MRTKRTIAALLALLLMLSALAGCGGQPSSSAPESSQPSSSSKAASQEASSEDASQPEEDGETYTVSVMTIGDAKTEDCNEVAAYISSITKDLAGVEVQLTRGVNGEQMNLALASGEKMDIVGAFPWVISMTTLVANGQIQPIDSLLEEYGQETLAMISEDDWKCVSLNGQKYGVPANKDKAQNKCFQMRKDFAEQLKIDTSAIKDLDSLEPVLRKVKEEMPDVYPLVSAAGSITLPLPVDDLTDSFGVIENALGNDTTVVNLYETKSYEEFVNRMYRWGQEGLIMPDAASNTSSIEQLLGAGAGFGGFVPSKPGAVLQASREASTELLQSEIVPAVSTTGMVACPYVIASSSENPAKAMQALNLMYTNYDVSTAFIYGIEGKHYQYVDKEHHVVDYADGVTTENTGYSVFGWAWPNQQVGAIWNGDDFDIWEQLSSFNTGAAASPAKGFVWNNEAVLNEITACENVASRYKNGLECGMLDPAETLPKFNQELKDAGIETIIAEKQRQLDEWLAQQ